MTTRDRRAGSALTGVALDLRHAARGLLKSPAFSLVAVVTLTLSIGANVFVAGVLQAVLLPKMDVVDPNGVYQVRIGPRRSGALLTTSYPAFEDFRQRNRTFSGLAGFYGYSQAVLHRGSAAVKVSGYEVTGNYFDLLGARPAMGRFFHAEDEQGAGSAPYVVLSDRLWRSAFQADRDVVGATVTLDEHPFTVIGVASPRFHGTERLAWPDYWLPMVNGRLRGRDALESRTSNAMTVIGRLRPGVSEPAAAGDLDAIARQLAQEYPQTDRDLAVRLIPTGLYGDDGDGIRGFLAGVTALALLLLLAACANLASLLAARTADRSRELAVRLALGASRVRLVRALLTEASMVALAGGIAGFLCGHALLEALDRWRPADRLALRVDVDWRVYVAGLALTFGSALLFGLPPAWRAWRGDPAQAMKTGASPTPWRRLSLRDVLLGAQIAICTLLVTASLVAVRGMVRALDTPIGIQPQGALLASLDFREAAEREGVSIARVQSILAAAQGTPGVTAVAAARNLPLGAAPRDIPVHRPGTADLTPANAAMGTRTYPVSPGYLETAGTRLLAGRDLSWQDSGRAPAVAIVNETFARRMWGADPAIGQTFYISQRLTEVVGVAQDGKYHDLMETPQAAVFLPLSSGAGGTLVVVARSQAASGEGAEALRRTLGALEPNVPIVVESWTDALDDHLRPARLAAVALGVMGSLAGMLVVTGIFGMAAHTVSRRRKEIGIRTALGARWRHVMSAAVGRPAMLLGIGAAAGLVSGVLASRLLGRIVYQADPGHPVVMIGVVLTMILLGVAGSALPAVRALGIDPAQLMREE
jgi:predicted permease